MRYRDGKPTKLPLIVKLHMVAAQYGQTPEQVRDWPADDFLMAMNLLGVTSK